MGEPMVKSLYKALKLLFYFDARHPEWVQNLDLLYKAGIISQDQYAWAMGYALRYKIFS